MHVLVTADTMGGVWVYVRELVTGLVRRGVTVTLVSFGEIPSPAQVAWMEELPQFDFRATGFSLEWMQDAPLDIEQSTDYLLSVIAEVKPDIVHLNQYAYGSMPVDVPKIVVAHSDVVSWWMAVHGVEPPHSKWSEWYRETLNSGISGADTVIAPSQWMLDALHRHYAHPAHSRVICNGRTPTLFNPHVTKEESVISVGRLWDAGKQISLLSQISLPVPVFIAGAQDHPDSATSSTLLTSSRVQYKGQLSEAQLRHLYSRASIYAATSRYEPFGLAPLEAALSRCAVVANDIPSFRELWGDSAVYFRTNDANSLQTVISPLVADRELRIQYGNRAYHRARERFTAERMVEEYLALYQTHVVPGVQAA